MAYNVWSVVAFEQPTAAKWNQLGTNDAGFRDGSNILWNNNQAIQANDSGSSARTVLKLSSSDILEIGDGANMEVGLKTMAKARVYRTAVQSIPDATATKVQFNGASYNPGSYFDISTNYRFDAPVTGYYKIDANVSMSLNTADQLMGLIYVDGAVASRSRIYMATTTNTLTVNINDILYVAAGSFIELYVYHTYGGARNLDFDEPNTFMAIHLLSI